jgi:PAS domain S-box-containing protein
VVALDDDDRVIYMNAAAERAYGVTASVALGRPREVLFEEAWLAPEDEGVFMDALQRADSSRYRSLHRKTGGHEVHVESAVSRLIGVDGVPMGLLHVIRDVTERERADAALREADRRKDEFLATLAHELRNPLAPIRSSLQVMRLSADPDAHRQARSMIERQVSQMVHLVDDLLDVGRITQGKVELRRQRIDLTRAIHAAIETSTPVIDASGHALDLRLPRDGAVMVDGDMTRLTQVVANLLNNAAKYTGAGGRITLSLSRETGDVGETAVIAVQDSGIGIPAAMLPRVFEMFTQVDRAQERSQGGLGIGLALVQRLVEMHGGTVDAASEGKGRGSTFTIRLPALASRQDDALPAPLPVDMPVGAPRSGPRVLVVDDNPDGAESLALMLSLLGCDACIGRDGLEAVRLAESFRPDLILLDIGLPLIDGHEAGRRIRQADWSRGVTLVALTGWGQDEDRRKSREAGFDEHLVKPIELEALQRLVEEQAASRLTPSSS